MADPINIPNHAQSAGIPGQWSQDISATDPALVTGHEPGLLTRDMVFATDQDIPALTPVGYNGSNELVPAVTGSVDPQDDIAPVAVTTIAVVTSGVGGEKAAPVYRAGCLNPDALNWPVSFDDDAKKFAAFEGAPTPTNIVLRRPQTATSA